MYCTFSNEDAFFGNLLLSLCPFQEGPHAVQAKGIFTLFLEVFFAFIWFSNILAEYLALYMSLGPRGSCPRDRAEVTSPTEQQTASRASFAVVLFIFKLSSLLISLGYLGVLAYKRKLSLSSREA